jgi:hypothetical protein
LSSDPPAGPSNLVIFVFAVIGAVVVWFGWATLHMQRHRSADQKILIEKSKQH